MKNIINKIKEKWFWIKHPNLEYQCEVEDEKRQWIRFLKSPDSDTFFTEEEKEKVLKTLEK